MVAHRLRQGGWHLDHDVRINQHGHPPLPRLPLIGPLQKRKQAAVVVGVTANYGQRVDGQVDGDQPRYEDVQLVVDFDEVKDAGEAAKVAQHVSARAAHDAVQSGAEISAYIVSKCTNKKKLQLIKADTLVFF